MKKLNLFLGLAAISIALMFNSCTEETHPVPTVAFDQASPVVLGVGVTSATLTGTIVAEAGLKTVEIRKMTGLSESLLQTVTSFSSGTVTSTDDVNYTFNYVLENITENTTLTVKAIDKDDQDASQSIEIEVTVGVELNTFTAVLMGAQSNADYGSTASLTTGEVYKITGSEAANHSEMVDIIYYYGSRLAALYSPSQSDIQNVSLYNIPSWTTINETMLGVSSLSSSEFDDVTYDTDLESAGTPTLDVVPELSENDVIVFETDSGKKGVFKVTDLSTGNDGYIEISVKVEE